MATAPIGRLLFKYSTPAMIAMLVNSLYNLVDSIFVGRGAGTLALAALAVSFPIQMIVLAAAQMVGIGSASLISRSLGAGNTRLAERAAGTSFATVIFISLLITISGLTTLKPLLILFGATEDVLPYAIDYLSIVLLGSIFFGFAVSSNNVVRAEGNAKMAMFTMLVGAGINLILDPIFIFGMNMGIRGAALATLIAHFSSFAFLFSYFISGRSLLKMKISDLRPDVSLLPEIFAVGSSSFMRMVAGSLVAIVLNNSIRWYGQDVHLAIIGVINRIMLFIAMPVFGLAQGVQPIIGFSYGARNPDRVRQAVRTASITATTICTIGFLAIILFARPIIQLFNNDDPQLLNQGAFALRLISISLPFVGFQVIGATYFQAAGKAIPALFLSMSRQILFFIPLLLILPPGMGINGIWITPPLADAASIFITAIWLFHSLKSIQRDGIPLQKDGSASQLRR